MPEFGFTGVPALDKIAGQHDMTQLADYKEESLLENLRIRFEQDLIYTYTGSILVAANPYKSIPIYGNEVFRKYKNVRIGELPPHIFAIADATFTTLFKERKNQCVVISGESGAGKTESTKFILQYLANLNSKHSLVEEQILMANPIMEAFGNAKTARNNNSSRFGKFIKVLFADSGIIQGATISDYLLEKSRIINQAKNERNYHVFYNLLAGATPEMKTSLLLDQMSTYRYLNFSDGGGVSGKDDKEDYHVLKEAMELLNFGKARIAEIFQLVAAVLSVGNIDFSSSDESGLVTSKISNPTAFEKVVTLLGVDADLLAKHLTYRATETRGEVFFTPLDQHQAEDTRDAVAKAIYGRMFSWIVKEINTNIDTKTSSNVGFVGILDIFGFEVFEVNRFEQFFINYANERLQQYFNQHIFKIEQEEYTSEGIDWANIDFADNQPILDLISKRPVGIVALLDEESGFPQCNDITFVTKVKKQFENDKNLLVNKRVQNMFGISHYAGEVFYIVDGFLDKNRDTLRPGIVDTLIGSKLPFVKELFVNFFAAPAASETSFMEKGKAKNAGKMTVGTQFLNSLNDLMQTLFESNPYFVRCIKPNPDKVSGKFDQQLVLHQLRYSGMMETVRIRSIGYPSRRRFEDFAFRYRVLIPKGQRFDKSNPLITIRAIMDAVKINHADPKNMQIGKSKIFYKDHVDKALDIMREVNIRKLAVRIQAWYKACIARRYFLLAKKSIRTIQYAYRSHLLKKRFQRIRYLMIRLQARARGVSVRRMYQRMKEAARKAAILEAERKQRQEAEAASLRRIAEQNNASESGNDGYSSNRNVNDNEAESIYSSIPGPPSAAIQILEKRNHKRKNSFFTLNLPSMNSGKSTVRRSSSIFKNKLNASENLLLLDVALAAKEISQEDFEEYKREIIDLELVVMQDLVKRGELSQKDFDRRKAAMMDGPSDLMTSVSMQDVKRQATLCCTFSEFAAIHFQKGCTATYQATPLYSSLLKLSDDLEGSAMLHFDTLNLILSGGTGDVLGSLHSLMSGVIESPRLADEIYCQICKQLSENPNEQSRQTGWLVLSLFLGCFPPSIPLARCLRDFIKNNDAIFEMGFLDYKAFCEQRLEKTTYLMTPRRYPVSELEISSARNVSDVSIPVHFMDNSFKQVQVDSLMDGAEMTERAAESLGITYLEGFAIFFVNGNSVIQIRDDDFVLDILSSHENAARNAGRLDTFTPMFFFKKQSFAHPYGDNFHSDDPVATKMIFAQISCDIAAGVYHTSPLDTVEMLGLVAAVEMKRDPSLVVSAAWLSPLVPMAQQKAVTVTKVNEAAEKFANLSEEEITHILIEKASNRTPSFAYTFPAVVATFPSESKVDIPIPFKKGDNVLLAIDHIGFHVCTMDKSSVLYTRDFNVIMSHQAELRDKDAFWKVTFIKDETMSFKILEKSDASILNRKLRLYIETLKLESKYAVALFDYNASDESLLALKKGDLIKIVEPEEEEEDEDDDEKGENDDDWIEGECNGKTGFVPRTYLHFLLCKPLEDPLGRSKQEVLADKTGSPSSAASGLSSIASSSAATGSAGNASSTKLPEKYTTTSDGFIVDENGVKMSAKDLAARKKLEEEANNERSKTQHEFETLDEVFKDNKFSLLQYVQSHFHDGKASVKSKSVRKSGSQQWGWGQLADQIKYSESPIRSSLHKLNSEETKIAVECFKTIMTYMGDYPRKKKSAEDHPIAMLVRTALMRPNLKNEIYCQVIKQTVNNRSKHQESLNRGWQLLFAFTSAFQPSPEFEMYLKKYLRDNAKDKKRSHYDVAGVCEKRLTTLKKYGDRKLEPSLYEIESIEHNAPLVVKVCFPGTKTYKNIHVTNLTTSREVVLQLCSRIQIFNTHEYGLHLVFEKDPRVPIVTVKNDSYIFDAINAQARLWKGDVQVQLRKRLWLTTDEWKKGGFLQEFIYYSILERYLTGFQRAESNTAALLAAYQFRVENPETDELMTNFCKVCQKPGNKRCGACKMVPYCGRQCQEQDWSDHADNCGKIDPEKLPWNWAKYIPADIRSQMRREEWETRLFSNNKIISGMSSLTAMTKFLETVMVWPSITSTPFQISQFCDSHGDNYGNCVLLLSAQKLTFIDPHSMKPIELVDFKDLTNYREQTKEDTKVGMPTLLNLKITDVSGKSKNLKVESPNLSDIIDMLATYLDAFNKANNGA